jgi:hypothetical protein
MGRTREVKGQGTHETKSALPEISRYYPWLAAP